MDLLPHEDLFKISQTESVDPTEYLLFELFLKLYHSAITPEKNENLTEKQIKNMANNTALLSYWPTLVINRFSTISDEKRSRKKYENLRRLLEIEDFFKPQLIKNHHCCPVNFFENAIT